MATGPTPACRYGHAAAIMGTRFYAFGGQIDTGFLNDIWALDFNSFELCYDSKSSIN